MRSKNLIACILLLLFSITVWAQESAMITGVVTDENKEPLIGVNIAIQNMPGLGVITDINGRYKIKASAYDRLVFSYIGYETVVVLVKEQKTINVKMKEAANTIIDEVVITGTGAQKKIAVTGAITNVDVDALKSVPSTSVVDGLAGVVPGVMAMQTSGRPGSVSEFWIRSISTFGANTAALVLVDGFERDIDEVSVEDIESFTVLKDASATAIYGSKGANGVVLINTKRGKEGKINIDAKVEGFYSTFTKAPEFVDGYTYASMANEARLTRNQEALYSPSELELFRTQLDPDRFPDVDWMDMVLRDGAWSSRATLNMRGGGKTARYFVSGSYQDQQGMYKTDKSLKDYNTNAHFRKWTSMANEARLTRNQEALYSPSELELFRTQLDPDRFPDVDWMDMVLRDGAWSSRATLNMRGGGKTARYFVSGSYQDQQGMYKTDKSLKDYNTNAHFRKWTYRMNVDIDITKTTLLKVGVSGSLRKQNDTGSGTDNLWTVLMGYNSIMMPAEYSDGKIPGWSDKDDNMNPWVMTTQSGYNESWKNNIQTSLTLEQKLDFVTKGLRFVGRFGYDTYNSNWIKRYKSPAAYKADRYRQPDGTLNFTKIRDEKVMSQSSNSEGEKREFFEWELHYSRAFKTHHVGGVLKYTQASKIFTQNIGTDLKNGIPYRNQGIAGRFSYNWNYRYFIDFNFGYNGSENFHKDHRFDSSRLSPVHGTWLRNHS